VAATGDGLLGWIGVERRSTLETGEKAEIVGLVIDARARRTGVGRALAEAAEDWARRQGFDALMVRSNAARIESHPFYLKHGYQLRKTQQVYLKPL
jgi:GNAT superfamily N-acetyltransferase